MCVSFSEECITLLSHLIKVNISMIATNRLLQIFYDVWANILTTTSWPDTLLRQYSGNYSKIVINSKAEYNWVICTAFFETAWLLSWSGLPFFNCPFKPLRADFDGLLHSLNDSLFLGDNRKGPGWILIETGRVQVDRDGPFFYSEIQ